MASKKGRSAPSVPAPSSSIVVVSPLNEILLLHRVQNGTFAAAHVFPGGNLSSFHEDGLIPAAESESRHVNGLGYELAGIRETFEESGILLARPAEKGSDDSLLVISAETAAAGRKSVERKEARFTEWLESVGGVADTAGLIPFTRWVTPTNLARRFTTQMYLYLMPLAAGPEGNNNSSNNSSSDHHGATADLTEVATAEFAPASVWVERAQRNEIILFPPQMYLLALLAPILRGGRPAEGTSTETSTRPLQHSYADERAQLWKMIRQGPGAPGDEQNQNQKQAWADVAISPRMLGKLPDGRSVMGLDQPGLELRDSGRTGDAHRVVVVGNMPPGPPQDVELKLRADVMPLIRVQAGKTNL